MNDVGVLTVVCLVGMAMTVRAALRLVRRRATFQGLAVAALVVWLGLTVAALTVEVRHQWVQNVATKAVREVSGRPGTQAVCTRRTADMLDLSNTAGKVMYDRPDVAVLRADTCADLASWLSGTKLSPTLAQVTAVHVLVHEAVHVSGEFNEATTECVAMSLDERVALSLGAPRTGAEALARTYAQQVHPHMPDLYRADCAIRVANP